MCGECLFLSQLLTEFSQRSISHIFWTAAGIVSSIFEFDIHCIDRIVLRPEAVPDYGAVRSNSLCPISIFFPCVAASSRYNKIYMQQNARLDQAWSLDPGRPDLRHQLDFDRLCPMVLPSTFSSGPERSLRRSICKCTSVFD